MADRLTEVYGQLDEAKEKLQEVVQDIEAAQQAVQAASDVDAAAIAAEDLRHQAATAIADVARMLCAEGPAAAIAEEIVDEDLSQMHASEKALRSAGSSPTAAAAARREGNAEKTL